MSTLSVGLLGHWFSGVGLIQLVVDLFALILVLSKEDVSLSNLLLKLLLSLLDQLLLLLQITKLLDGVAHAVAHPDQVGDVAGG